MDHRLFDPYPRKCELLAPKENDGECLDLTRKCFINRQVIHHRLHDEPLWLDHESTVLMVLFSRSSRKLGMVRSCPNVLIDRGHKDERRARAGHSVSNNRHLEIGYPSHISVFLFLPFL